MDRAMSADTNTAMRMLRIKTAVRRNKRAETAESLSARVSDSARTQPGLPGTGA